ncbi:hypothetical protein FB45DRAFT_176807 [Roridomyces roridus]|uniref:Secreted protein n=1 Tax=Roridomyces roridus TaxID=1738132 RepID=A0AAD7FVT5_9AGAR|nr:hypothetical protein FB45DRAFT_176807 [Roridomyces roridus]
MREWVLLARSLLATGCAVLDKVPDRVQAYHGLVKRLHMRPGSKHACIRDAHTSHAFSSRVVSGSHTCRIPAPV